MIITAKFASVCPCCSNRISVGEKVEWSRSEKARHAACASKPSVASTTRRRYYGRSSGAGYGPSVPGYSSWCTDRPGCGCYDCAS